MKTNKMIFILYIASVSLISAAVTIIDKMNAKRKARRIPEKTLILLASLGGSATMFLTMLIIRHKTRHIKFMIGIPLIMLFQVIFILWFLTQF